MSQFEPNSQLKRNKQILYNFAFQILYFKITKILKNCVTNLTNSQLKFYVKS